MRIAYLGPAGTFSDDALRAAVGDREVEPCPGRPSTRRSPRSPRARPTGPSCPSRTRSRGRCGPTLDALAFDAPSVTIAGEHDHPVSHSLIARTRARAGRDRGGALAPAGERAVRPLHPRAACRAPRPRAAGSTAEAVRDGERVRRALGRARRRLGRRALRRVVLREGVEDEPDNVTRFVWVAPGGHRGRGRRARGARRLIFSELGEDHPGALVDALTELSSREVNMTRIESRPLRRGLGRYMFFIDLDGAGDEPTVAEAIEALRGKAESVRAARQLPDRGRRACPAPDATRGRGAPLYNSPRHGGWCGGRRRGRTGRVPRTGTPSTATHGRRPHERARPRRPGAGAERQLRADQRLHDAPRRGARAQGAGRGARAAARERFARSASRWRARA